MLVLLVLASVLVYGCSPNSPLFPKLQHFFARTACPMLLCVAFFPNPRFLHDPLAF